MNESTNLDYLEEAKSWCQNTYFDEDFRDEISRLIEEKNFLEIEERFYKDIEFGTGGLRNIIGAGKNRINKYTIMRATQAVSNVVKRTSKDEYKVCVSFDSRKFSKEFAKITCQVFAANNIKAYLFDELTPVPVLAYSIGKLNADAGVMITASHNPKNYNGYKVYWSNGAQVTPPNDQIIIDQYNNILDFSTIKYIEYDEAINKSLIKSMPIEVTDSYFSMLKNCCFNPKLIQDNPEDLKVVYTALHGTGGKFCTRALEQIGFRNILTVEEQQAPDSNFPTVKFPNPEEPEALSMAVDLMLQEKADMAFGTDPDTDRLGVALRLDKDKVYFLNGNEIGLLLLHYCLESLRENNLNDENKLFVKTVVTSPLQEVLCKHYGVRIESTLTGFKWIGKKVEEIIEDNPKAKFIFANEESFGYLSHPYIKDKDGINAAALFAEMSLWWKKKNKNLIQALSEIHEQFGYSKEKLLTFKLEGKIGSEKISSIVDKFRSFKKDAFFINPIKMIEDFKFQKKYEFSKSENQSVICNEMDFSEYPVSNVLGLYFEDGNRLFLRPSGTEPKLKFYIMLQKTDGSLEEKKISLEKSIETFTNEINKLVEGI